MQNINKILIVEIAGIGDVVMSIPAIRALRRRYPQAYIAALVSPRAVPLLKRCPYLNEVFRFEIDNFKISKSALNISQTFSSLRTTLILRLKRFDAAINLYELATFWGTLRMKAFFKAINPRLSVGRDKPGKGKYFQLSFIEEPALALHEVETKLRVVGLLQAVPDQEGLELWPDDEDDAYIQGLLKRLGIRKNDFLIGINPNAFQRPNLWLEERFARLADLLIASYGAKVIFFGSAVEKVRIKRIVSYMKNSPLNLADKLTLSQYVGLLKRIKVFITLDSGPMHIAGVFKVPTIALFGSGRPLRFGPYQNDQAVVVQKMVGCNPCNKKMKCTEVVCMKAITVDDVLKAFEKLTKGYQTSPATSGCNLCGGLRPGVLFQREGIDIVRCKSCGLIYRGLKPGPDQQLKLYRKAPLIKESRERFIKSRAILLKYFLGQLNRQAKKGKVLDIGCQYGYFPGSVNDFRDAQLSIANSRADVDSRRGLQQFLCCRILCTKTERSQY